MKLSELQELLKSFEDKFGDLEIKTYDIDNDLTKDILRSNFSATSFNEVGPPVMEYIQIWI
jgi:hypothetical protein